MIEHRRWWATVALCALSWGCGGGDGDSPGAFDAAPPIDADPAVLRVGGEYATEVSLGQSTCEGITVQSMPTIVGHTPGAAELTLTHAGQTYSGGVERDGAFATEPEPVGTPAELHTLTITGGFSTTGFEATVDAAVSRDGTHDCDYQVNWAGTKAGEPNVIPG
ncbi:MAG TPA: hypothetical protein VK698_38585 [Kofleriaceae bacterium]|nr:hypothetical protein [Kofleriaceae bacterium]